MFLNSIMDKEVIITTIQAADDSALASMIRGVFDEYKAPTEGTVYVDPTTDHLSKVFDAKGSVLFVAKVEDRVVGSCGLYPTEGLPEGHVELVKFYISKEARGQVSEDCLWKNAMNRPKSSDILIFILKAYRLLEKRLVFMKSRDSNSYLLL